MIASILIPSWNRKDNLLKTLSCLEKQEFDPKHIFDIIVVDDASTDGTWDAINNIKYFNLPQFRKFKPLRRENRTYWGAGPAKNTGAKESSEDSEVLIGIDSDVLLPPHVLQTYAEDYEVEKSDTRVIIGPYHFLQEPITHITENWWINKAPYMKYTPDIRLKSFQEHPFEEHLEGLGVALSSFGGNILIPRKLFFKAGGFDENPIVTQGEDGDFGMTMWECGAKSSYDMRLLGWHNPHPIDHQARNGNQAQLIEYLDTKHKVDLIKENGKVMRQRGVDWVVSDEIIKSAGYNIDDPFFK